MMARRNTGLLTLAAAFCLAVPGFAQEIPGRTLSSLLDYARDNNPEYAAMRHEATAAEERITPAGSLADPKFRTEFRDITRMGEQNATLAPNRVGSTRYLLMQDLPWYGKRDLKQGIAELEAEAAHGRARGTWAELAAKLKATHAQRYFVQQNTSLAQEVLALMQQLEKIAQARYAGGVAAQQDVIRAQVEQTAMRNELIALENEGKLLHARMNALLSRPINARLADAEQPRALPKPARLDFSELEDRVRGRNPQLFAEEAKIKAAEKSRDLTYKNRYPDFTVGVSPIQYQSAVKEWELMVEINIPLQQASRRAQERESEAMLSAARARKEAAANQILADLAENLAAIEAARHSELLASTRLLPQAELSFKSALAGYENGKVDFATLLDAQRQIRLARQSQLKAQTDAQMRLVDVEKRLGEDL